MRTVVLDRLRECDDDKGIGGSQKCADVICMWLPSLASEMSLRNAGFFCTHTHTHTNGKHEKHSPTSSREIKCPYEGDSVSAMQATHLSTVEHGRKE